MAGTFGNFAGVAKKGDSLALGVPDVHALMVQRTAESKAKFSLLFDWQQLSRFSEKVRIEK